MTQTWRSGRESYTFWQVEEHTHTRKLLTHISRRTGRREGGCSSQAGTNEVYDSPAHLPVIRLPFERRIFTVTTELRLPLKR
jgi:hypothetical protein